MIRPRSWLETLCTDDTTVPGIDTTRQFDRRLVSLIAAARSWAAEGLGDGSELDAAAGLVGIGDAQTLDLNLADGLVGPFGEPEVQLADGGRVFCGGVGERAGVQNNIDPAKPWTASVVTRAATGSAPAR
jgi:hypothetical protein